MSDLPPLDDDLRALFAEERESYTFDERRADRLYRRVQTTVAFDARVSPAPPPPAPPVSPGLAPWKAIAFAAVAFGVGVFAGKSSDSSGMRAPLVAPADSAPVTPSAAPSAPTQDEMVDAAAAPTPSAPPEVHPSTTASTTPSSATGPRPSTLAEEQALVDRARAALSRGRGQDALAATSEHARSFPHGRLAEEREMLAIQALVATGNRADARARADRFAIAFPKSVFLPSIEKVVAK